MDSLQGGLGSAIEERGAGPKSSGPCIKRRMLWYLVLVSHLVQSAIAVAAGARVAVSTGITAPPFTMSINNVIGAAKTSARRQKGSTVVE